MSISIIIFLYRSGSPQVYAGKCGRYYRHDTMDLDGELITDWGRIVKLVTVSSKRPVRFEIPGTVWQSCGTQGKVRCFITPTIFYITAISSIGFDWICNKML